MENKIRRAVTRMPQSHLWSLCPLLLAAGLLASCDTPQKKGLRELSKAGIAPSGSSLLEAVSSGNQQAVGWLLDVGVYTEQRDDHGRTPVRVALEKGDLPSVFKLLDADVNVNASAPDQVSILGIAVERGETAIVERLLAAGARPDGLMPDGEKILPWAIREGRMSFVRSMMEYGADPHLKDRMGNPLLHVAMETGRKDLAEALIELGADSAATNAAGETTLQVACRRGWLDALPKLANAGADPNAPGVDGRTLLDRAVDQGDLAQVSRLLDIGANPNLRHFSGEGPTALERVMAQKRMDLFELFLARGVKPSGGSWDPWLWKAYAARDRAQALVLLRHGAKATARCSGGMLLLETAAHDREASFVKLLMDYGSPAGFSLYHASARGDAEMVGLLLACGLSPNGTLFPSKDTPLSVAIRGGHDLAAELLVRGGADTGLNLPEGQSLFHLAVATGCGRSLKCFLESGADPNASFTLPVSPEFLRNVRKGVARWALKNDRNVTPLMVASDSGNVTVARNLIRAGAKMNVRTKSSNLWPINFASRRNDVAMMRLFLGRDPIREERHIEIRLSEQRARLYDGDGNELFNTKVSTGRKGFATPTGEFVITNKYKDWTSTLYHASMPYFQRLSCSDFGLHQGVVPGYPASHGCIRVPAGNAAKLFTMTQAGDRVRIIP